jgi:L-lysine 6-transaminase
VSHYQVSPDQVIPTLQKNILVDGFHVIIDLEKSKGSYIHDAVSGKDLLDFYSYFASLPVGHNHPKLTNDPEFIKALTRAAIANPANSDIYCPEYAAFVEQFAKHAMPAELKYLFFVAGGALAIENALKTAFDWKVRKNRAAGKGEKGSKILHFRECFHGRSGYTMSLTNTDPVKTDLFPKFSDWPRITNPKIQFPLDDKENKRVAEVEARAVAEIEDAFARYPDDIAAIIIEPIQGEGGDNHFRKEFFVELRRLADKHDALLIFDEVQTGGGLTGKLWAYQHFGVTPDILAFGKKFQVCGIAVGPRIDEVKDNVFKVSSRINSTWGGNLVDMVRCIKYLEIIREEKLVENAAAMGEKMLGGLRDMAKKFDCISNVRGRGLFVAFTLKDTAQRNAIRQACWDAGLASLSSGSTSIRFRPCLTVTAAEIDKAMGILEQALEKTIGKKRAAG